MNTWVIYLVMQLDNLIAATIVLCTSLTLFHVFMLAYITSDMYGKEKEKALRLLRKTAMSIPALFLLAAFMPSTKTAAAMLEAVAH